MFLFTFTTDQISTTLNNHTKYQFHSCKGKHEKWNTPLQRRRGILELVESNLFQDTCKNDD